MQQRVGVWCEPMQEIGNTLSRVGLVKATASNETRTPTLQGKALFGLFK